MHFGKEIKGCLYGWFIATNISNVEVYIANRTLIVKYNMWGYFVLFRGSNLASNASGKKYKNITFNMLTLTHNN